MYTFLDEVITALSSHPLSTYPGKNVFMENHKLLVDAIWPDVKQSGLAELILNEITDERVIVSL